MMDDRTGLEQVTSYDLRDKLTDMVIRDLLGPAGGPDEELSQFEDRVRERYLVGALAPRKVTVKAEELDALGTGEADDPETGTTDTAAPAQESMMPSSMGMSLVVTHQVNAVRVYSEWGKYRRIESETQKRRTGEPALAWKREPVEGETLVLPLKEGRVTPLIPHSEYPRVIIRGKIRHSQIGWVVTLFLVNEQEEPSQRKDEAWLFQAKLRVTSDSEYPAPIFVQRHYQTHDLSLMDPLTREETETLDMLYRHRLDFAVGHGTSVHVTGCEEDSERATVIETEFVPHHEVPRQTPPTPEDVPELEGVVLDMKRLFEMPKQELLSTLRQLPAAYEAWLEREQAKLHDPAEKLDEHQPAAQRALANCHHALARIREGIDLLEHDPIAEKAFRFANEAMYLQRVRSTFARRVRQQEMKPEDDWRVLDVPKNRSWRLFQLAFVLLNLPSISDLHHHERSDDTEAVANLLWFATGGGKTEAYLGLTAYTLALRRLQGEIEGRSGQHGVAVLMRYTLRLLTLQQFQRAAALLCACEVIRREDPASWGDEPFRLGLWVGSKATPNKLQHADETLRSSNTGGRPKQGGSPHQLASCPWCGREIKPQHLRIYQPPSDIGRCVTYCGDTLGRCEFSERQAPREGLPVMVVDEDIYRRPPALLIATVDKFAQMPWKGEVQMLFGMVNGLCPRHGFLSPDIDDSQSHPARNGLPRVHNEPHGLLRPPDLIIQDELHLISGPLGSMVGLYETAVDELCSWQVGGKKVRPKVIASTATIRRAADQVKKLYVRQLAVFPPQGTDIRDSFFALERPSSRTHPGRRYLGISAFGRRYTDVLIRVYIAFLAASQRLYEDYDQLADPYMTLVGYFNSIRELAGAKRLTEDEIRARLRDADKRGLAKRRLRFGAIEELTSRKSGADIPSVLQRLEIGFDQQQEAQREAARKAGEPRSPHPYDVVLATNMISVGVDIDRLGLMVVSGQPKNTSEYIQATSRVGRTSEGPGLVCTLYNWARPRDLSHFENFQHYHDTFYKHVEALSVTPFAKRALDRGLSGVFVGLTRLKAQHLNANDAAGTLQDTDPLIRQVKEIIAKRAEDAMDDKDDRNEVERMLDERRDTWLKLVRQGNDYRLEYKASGGNAVSLLKNPVEEQNHLFTCLNSLRDVEATASLILDEENPKGLNLRYEEGAADHDRSHR